MALSPGARLGPYEIVNLIGAGGMGEVYRARDTRLNRTVAIKILPGHVAAAPGFRERFEREGRTISAVEHPHICALYDVGHDRPSAASAGEGLDYLVMQFVDGETLADRIGRGPVSPSEAIRLAQQIAAGLEAAHERGIVHRDLKPSNVMVTRNGEVKILDFGLARSLAPVGSDVDPATSPTFTAASTHAGVIVGSAAYMSPEQARGRAIDKRTDIWAFGCVLFEMLSGRRAFDGETVTDVLAAVVGREPEWNALPADTPPRIRGLLRRCFQKDPARRLRDIGDARLELEDAEAEPPEAPGATRSDSARRRSATAAWAVAAIAVLVALGALGALAWLRPDPARRAPMRFSTVTNFSGIEAQPSLSPDGRSVAFVSNRGGQWDIYVGLVTGGSLIRITNDANLDTRPRWSPDGTRILFARLNDTGLHDVWVVPALGGAARRVVANGFQPTWSADGRSIAYSSGGSIWIAGSSGANPREVVRPEPFQADFQATFSRDGRSLAFVRRRFGAFGAPYGALTVADVASGAVKYLTGDDALPLSPVWSPDDRFIYFTWSRGGALNVWKIPAAGGEPEQITAGQGDDTDIDLSADGTRLVFSSFRQNVNLAEVSLDRASKGRLAWLTTDAARGENAPRYSPDGHRIAYFSNRIGAEWESIWLMDADGGNAHKLVEEEGRASIFPRWTPDGQELLFMSRTASRFSGVWSLVDIGELRRVSVAGGVPQALPIKPWSPSWGDVAPDGRIIYRPSPTAGEVYDPRTNQRQPIGDMRGDPLWSRDGRSFAFAVRPGVGKPSEAGLWTETPGGGRRHVFPGWVVWFAWAGAEELLVLEGKRHLKGVLWQIDARGRSKVVALEELPIFMRHTDVSASPIRFDAHPDGGRIVIEAFESFESDIGMIDNVR